MQKKTLISVLAILMLAALLILPVGTVLAATSVNENFEDGVANGFSVATGTYSIVADGSQVYKTTSATARAVVGDVASTNVNVQADVKVASWSASTGRTVGLLARYTNTSNYYLFIYEDGQLMIKKKVGGTLSTVASKAYTFNTGTWYTFKGVVNGTSLTMFVNGNQELSATTTGLTAGQVGLTSFNGDVRNDNFIASDITGGSTLTPTRTSTRTPTSIITLTPTRTPTPTFTPIPGGSNDQFGLKKLYPSVGREWFNVWSSGSQRTLTWDTYSSDPGMVFRGDTTALVYGSSGTRTGQMQVIGDAPRIYIRDSGTEAIPPADSVLKWNNVEVTFYAYSTGNSGVGWAGLEAVVKTNHLPDTWDCATRGYGGRMLFDGRLDFEKEVSHPSDINVQQSIGNWSGGLPLNRWIGFKYVARNVDNNTHVKLELYRELSIGNVVNPSAPAGGGTWELLGTYTDTGSWSTGFGSCTAQTSWDNGHTDRSLPLTWANWSVYLRTDGLTSSIPQYYKWLSVREIAPLP
jgi:hypothetical protein